MGIEMSYDSFLSVVSRQIGILRSQQIDLEEDMEGMSDKEITQLSRMLRDSHVIRNRANQLENMMRTVEPSGSHIFIHPIMMTTMTEAGIEL